MKEKFDQEKQALKEELDEVRLQIALGKAEAADYLEKRKDEFARVVDEMQHNLVELGTPASNATKRLKGKLDHLAVQLALGRMESHDAYCSQRSRIVDAIEGIEEDLDEVVGEGRSKAQDLQTSFEEHAGRFKMKLESAALTLGAGAMLAAHEVEDTIEKTANNKLWCFYFIPL